MPSRVNKFDEMVKEAGEATVVADRIVALTGKQVTKQTTKQKKAVAVALGKRTASTGQKSRVAHHSTEPRTVRRKKTVK
jgi:hypothetical protein